MCATLSPSEEERDKNIVIVITTTIVLGIELVEAARCSSYLHFAKLPCCYSNTLPVDTQLYQSYPRCGNGAFVLVCHMDGKSRKLARRATVLQQRVHTGPLMVKHGAIQCDPVEVAKCPHRAIFPRETAPYAVYNFA